MKIFFSAAEASSDTHAAEALKRLAALCVKKGVKLDAFGVGGPKLRAAGLRVILPAEELLAMGFVEVVGRLPKIRRDLARLAEVAAAERPDAAVLCDYPDFHFKLAKRFKPLGFPIACFIPPKIWVWRKSRIRFLAEFYDRVLSILPFEEGVYAGTGVSFRYVGNPLMDELPLTLTREAARNTLGITGADPVLVLMVGSRPSEFRFHLAPMIQAARITRDALPGGRLKILIPLPETADLEHFRQKLAEIPEAGNLDLQVSRGDAWTAMKAADAGLVKSGTSSLEAALLDLPHVVIYRAHPVSELIFKHLIRYRKAISLTNLIGASGPESRVVPELILENFTPEKMADELLRLLGAEGAGRARVMRTAFAEIRRILGERSPSECVAEEIYNLASRKGGP
jgi:lipid-A-disaccharide synthase